MNRKTIFAVLAGLALLVSITSCRNKPDAMPEPAPVETAEPAAADVEPVVETPLDTEVIDESALADEGFAAKTVDDLNREGILEDVYFEFDKSRLTTETREALKQHAQWLNDHPTVKIIIEGHCDERGTEQYNMALGDRRAFSVKNYLISLGVPSHQMETFSWGEQVPKVEGSGEWAWSQNRRAHFVIREK